MSGHTPAHAWDHQAAALAAEASLRATLTGRDALRRLVADLAWCGLKRGDTAWSKAVCKLSNLIDEIDGSDKAIEAAVSRIVGRHAA